MTPVRKDYALKTKRRAFTLIELLVVVLILAVLAALIVPRVIGKSGDAKHSKAASDIAALRASLQNFRLDCDRYPTDEEGLQALRSAPGDVKNWRGPYLDRPLPPDPWGEPYIYEVNGDEIRVISYGRDKVPGGVDEDADIGDESDE